MSGPASLFDATLDPVAGQVKHWKDLKIDSTSGLSQSVYTPSGFAPEDIEVTDTNGGDAAWSGSLFLEQNVNKRGAAAPEQQEEPPAVTPHPAEIPSAFSALFDTSCDNHLFECVNSTEDTSPDVLRIIKHKPSAIVFCDYEGSLATVMKESSDSRESSSSSPASKEESEDEEADVDEFPETLQYKEFLVSRHRRNLNKNRKFLRKRPEVLPHGPAADRPKTSKSNMRLECAGGKEEEDTRQECDSMILLMKKLDHLSEGMQNIQNCNSSHINDIRVKEEQQGTKDGGIIQHETSLSLKDRSLVHKLN
ncbi:uncharacterized protein LOC129373393 [Poeciliopsis prolifica]|uniref:uncharacterized protein LOC129373393 n=1 Tax=Poeciliopsis prolifica TaxID=188132 RepID=UPI0024132F03|nr:uncharacterized protein LOC129373393 [Poeciliopsis prolifica]